MITDATGSIKITEPGILHVCFCGEHVDQIPIEKLRDLHITVYYVDDAGDWVQWKPDAPDRTAEADS